MHRFTHVVIGVVTYPVVDVGKEVSIVVMVCVVTDFVKCGVQVVVACRTMYIAVVVRGGSSGVVPGGGTDLDVVGFGVGRGMIVIVSGGGTGFVVVGSGVGRAFVVVGSGVGRGFVVVGSGGGIGLVVVGSRVGIAVVVVGGG